MRWPGLSTRPSTAPQIRGRSPSSSPVWPLKPIAPDPLCTHERRSSSIHTHRRIRHPSRQPYHPVRTRGVGAFGAPTELKSAGKSSTSLSWTRHARKHIPLAKQISSNRAICHSTTSSLGPRQTRSTPAAARHGATGMVWQTRHRTRGSAFNSRSPSLSVACASTSRSRHMRPLHLPLNTRSGTALTLPQLRG